jgi:hypothetical protein
MVVNSTQSFDIIDFEVYDLKDKMQDLVVFYCRFQTKRPPIFLENRIRGLVSIMTFKN